MANRVDPGGSAGQNAATVAMEGGAPAPTTTSVATPSPPPVPQTRSQAGLLAGSDFTSGFNLKSVLDLGMKYVGTPYVWGGEDPSTGFDCSGLVQYIYSANGVHLPRVAHDQASAGTAVAAKDAQPGDLVLFDNNPNRSGADHVGIYLGNGLMLQSPHTGANVQVVKVNLASAMTIRRVAPTKPTTYNGLSTAGGKYVYDAKVTPGATPPKKVTPAKGGGDVASNPTALASTAPAPNAGGGPLPPNATPQQIKDEVARSYGYLAAFLSDPELGPILSKAAIEDWDEARLTGALTATKWWQTHSDATRQWDALNKLDPAKAKGQLDSQMASIRDLAQQRGIVLPGNALHDMSVNALRFGWNSAQVNDALEQQGKLDPKTAKVNIQKLRELANEWMVPMSDQALDKWSSDIAFGKMTDDDYANYLKEQAKSLFPTLAGAIDRGVTVKQYTDPYRQYAAQILEVNPDSIDLMHDPKFSKALFNTDPKTGERQQMSLSDWQRYLRSTPDYAKTAQAVDAGAQFATLLTQQFGKVA